MAGEGFARFLTTCADRFVSKFYRKMSGSIVPSIEPTPTLISTPTPTLLLSNGTPESRPGRHNRRIKGQTWTLIQHAPNIRRKSRVSRIWSHGGEYINANGSNEDYRWIYDLCNSMIIVKDS